MKGTSCRGSSANERNLTAKGVIETTYVVGVDPMRISTGRREGIDFEHGIVGRNLLETDITMPCDIGPTGNIFKSSDQS
jgi:hypothetical protein